MLIALAVPIAAAVNLVTLKHAGRSVDLIPAVLLGAMHFRRRSPCPSPCPSRRTRTTSSCWPMLGCLQLGLPCMLLVRVSPQLSAPEIALLALLEVVLGPLWVWLGAGEAPALATLAGGALVIAALLLNELAALGALARAAELAAAFRRLSVRPRLIGAAGFDQDQYLSR